MIEGIAVNYRKDDAWKLIFPLDDCHRLRFRTGEVNSENLNSFGLPFGKKGFRIDISVSNPSFPEPVEGETYENFVDLTGEATHSSGLVLKDSLENLDATLISIKNGEFKTSNETEQGFRILNTSGRPVTADFKSVGEHGRIIVRGETLTVNVSGPFTNFSFSFSEPAKITFDNDCEGANETDIGDLQLLYKILADAVNPDAVKFGLEGNPDFVEPLASTDPTDPDPSPRGPICAMFRISNPGSLPS
jgi:hypothetical protein